MYGVTSFITFTSVTAPKSLHAYSLILVLSIISIPVIRTTWTLLIQVPTDVILYPAYAHPHRRIPHADYLKSKVTLGQIRYHDWPNNATRATDVLLVLVRSAVIKMSSSAETSVKHPAEFQPRLLALHHFFRGRSLSLLLVLPRCLYDVIYSKEHASSLKYRGENTSVDNIHLRKS